MPFKNLGFQNQSMCSMRFDVSVCMCVCVFVVCVFDLCILRKRICEVQSFSQWWHTIAKSHWYLVIMDLLRQLQYIFLMCEHNCMFSRIIENEFVTYLFERNVFWQYLAPFFEISISLQKILSLENALSVGVACVSPKTAFDVLYLP